jgi:hypothetical protein
MKAMTDQSATAEAQDHKGHQDVTVEVFAPRSAEPKRFTWSLVLTVGEAARVAATAFGYEGGDPTLGHGERVFRRSETLAQAHVHDGEKLELLDAGGGV